MRVYKFLSAKYALKDIIERRIKLSTFQDMNDPFELAGSRWSEPNVDEFITSFSAENVGALCFSKNWSDPLLWSHYADKHKGICLGLDIPDRPDAWKTPIYVDRPEVMDPRVLYEAHQTGDSEPAEEPLMRKLRLKFKRWDYEDEVRVFSLLTGNSGCRCRWARRLGILGEELSYFAFNGNLILRQVIVGVRCTVSRGKIEERLRGYSEPIEIIKAQLSFESFQVVEDPDGFAS